MKRNRASPGATIGFTAAGVAIAAAAWGMAHQPDDQPIMAHGAATPSAPSGAIPVLPGVPVNTTATVIAPPPASVTATTVAPSSNAPGFAQQVLQAVNQVRARGQRCGNEAFAPAPPLVEHPQLTLAAKRHAEDQARHRFMSHAGSTGSNPAARITAAGYGWRAVGENVAMGQTTPTEVVDDWVSSPGHCKNIMDPTYIHMGIGLAHDVHGAPYWAQTFGAPR